jgi:hypothetical protein
VATVEDPRVLHFDAEQELIGVIEPREDGPEFQFISGLAVSKDGFLAVCDMVATPVQIFDPGGAFLRGFGGRDIARQDFSAPIALAFDAEDFLYAVDLLRHDVKVFDLEGGFQTSFGGRFSPTSGGRLPGEMLYPTSVALDPNGFVYVAERFGQRVQVFERRIVEQDDGKPRLRIPKIPTLDEK